MIYGEILDKVKAYMDEVGAIDGALLVDIDTEKPIDMLIAEALDSAWRSFVFHSPLHYLPIKTVTAKTITSLVIIVAKPTDFIRLASFMVSTWSRPVFQGYYETDPIYAMQRNEYTKGTPTRPVVIIRPATLEGYSAVTANDTLSMTYVPSVDFTDKTTDIIPDSVSSAFCYHIAGNVYDILGSAVAKTMYANRDALCV